MTGAVALAGLTASCERHGPADMPSGAAAGEEHGERQGGDHAEHGSQLDRPHHGHGARAGAEAPSDLDRPVGELVGLRCEHDKRSYECDECRYEVGFVRAPAALIEGGLVTTVEAERQKVAVALALTGEARFDERLVGHVSSQVGGTITRVFVVLGDRVEKGQPLLELESIVVGDEQAANLEAEGMLGLAERSFERVSELRKEGIVSEREFLQARRDLDAAAIRARAARSRLARLGTGGTEGGRVVLRAPLDGTVLVMHAVAGEVVRTDESLVTVGDHKTLWVWADLYERDIAAVKEAQAAHPLPASVTVKAYPGVEFPGTVDLVSPAMEDSSRTVKVRVAVANEDSRLLAGMFATVKVFLPGTDEALGVPANAVLEDEGRSFVFVHHEGEYYVRRPVKVGRKWAGTVEILAGLEPAQLVVAEGAFLMKSDVLRSKMGAGCAD